MTTLTAALKQMLNALACADAGEFLTGKQKNRYLHQVLEPRLLQTMVLHAGGMDTKPPTSDRYRHVAMYMGSELPADMMTYIVQTCARLQHSLTVLTFQPENECRVLLEPYMSMLTEAGIGMQLKVLTGDTLPGLARYLREHPEVAFLACSDTGYLGRSFRNGTQRNNVLPVPVVLVESQREGANRSMADQGDETASKVSVA